MKASFATATLALVGCAFQHATCQELASVKVPAGTEFQIAQHSSFNGECSSNGIPDIQISRKPEHGSIDIRIQQVKIQNISSGSTYCLGRVVEGVAIFFKPSRGFKGSDSVSYHVDFPHQGALPGASRNRTLSISVE